MTVYMSLNNDGDDLFLTTSMTAPTSRTAATTPPTIRPVSEDSDGIGANVGAGVGAKV